MTRLPHNWPVRLPVRRPAGRLGVAVLLIGLMVVASPAAAQDLGGQAPGVDADRQQPADDDGDQSAADDDAEDRDRDDAPSEAEDVAPPQRPIEQESEVDQAVERQIEAAQSDVHIYQLAEEMIDEVIADVAQLNPGPLGPTALRQMNLTPNLADQFGEFVESTLVTALANHTDVGVKRCVACNATRSSVDDDGWTITHGMVDQDELADEAERLGVETFLDTRFSFYPDANVVAMQVEVFRAEDGAVLWSETYRSDATTAAILRTGDRVESRAERVEELEQRIDERPYYGHQLTAGFGYIPYDAPDGGLGGMMAGYRLYEQFGDQYQFLYAIGADGFANFGEGDEIMGAFVYGMLQAEIFEPNLNEPTYRTGPAIGGFVAGSEGNSFVAHWAFDATFQFRLGAGASVFYFVPTEFAGHDLGGFGLKGRISFNW